MDYSKKILIVDDEPSIVLAIESLLTANKYITAKHFCNNTTYLSMLSRGRWVRLTV